jgi:hypothetical protein
MSEPTRPERGIGPGISPGTDPGSDPRTDPGIRFDAVSRRLAENTSARQARVIRLITEQVISAETWDESVYENRPDGDWVLVSRESWNRIKSAVDAADAWRPWES